MGELDEGSQILFLQHFTANEAAIRAFVRRLVPLRSDTNDVMQQVAMVLWKKFEQLEVKDDFRKWAFGVARYEALAWSRDKARDRLVLAEDVLVALADESLATEPALSAQRDALDGCLEKLAAEHRRMILDAYSPGVRIQDVASRSQRSVAGFYQWLHRIRLQLLDCVKRNLAVEGVS